jgi:hypothetical protein
MSFTIVMSCVSESWSISVPVVALPMIQSSWAIACAVIALSPVIIITLIQAFLQVAMASFTSFLGGSIIAWSPTKMRSSSCILCCVISL